jgi:hypothetical protein
MGSQGSQARLLIDASAPSTTSQQFEFISESLAKAGTIIDTSGIRGTRSHFSARTRFGNYSCRGNIKMQPNNGELALLLPWVLGAAQTGSGPYAYALAETLTNRNVWVDRVAEVFQYAGVYVNKATLSARQGEPLDVDLELIGMTETVHAESGGFLSTTAPIEAPPYVFMDGILTISCTTYLMKDFTISIDNKLDVQFNNSVTATKIDPMDRGIGVEFGTPFTSSDSNPETALYGLALAGVAITLVLTNTADASSTLTITLPCVQFPDMSPVVPGKTEIPLRMRGEARVASGGATNSELSMALSALT